MTVQRQTEDLILPSRHHLQLKTVSDDLHECVNQLVQPYLLPLAAAYPEMGRRCRWLYPLHFLCVRNCVTLTLSFLRYAVETTVENLPPRRTIEFLFHSYQSHVSLPVTVGCCSDPTTFY